MEEKSVKFSEDQAFQLLCAALQNGAITLPFGKEIQAKLLESLKEVPQNITRDDVVNKVVRDQLKPCARADATYLLTFYRRLVSGIRE